MAVNDNIPKVKVDILVDNVAVQQYEDDEESQGSTNTVTKYIKAKSEAEFAFQYKFEETPQYALSTDFYLDGNWVASRILALSNLCNGPLHGKIEGVKSNQTGTWMLARFSFSNLKTVDSARSASKSELVKELKDLGHIAAKFYYVTNLRLAIAKVLSPCVDEKSDGKVPLKP